MPAKIKDITGNRYGKLVVIHKDISDKKGVRWFCKCDCGNYKTVASRHLIGGNTQSCGCNKIESALKRRKKDGVVSLDHLYMSYKRRAETKGYGFSLSKEEFKDLVDKPCFYCGSPPSREHKAKGATSAYICNGIDRVDNNLGYVVNNVVPCCKYCNIAKGSRDQISFIDWAHAVSNTFK